MFNYFRSSESKETTPAEYWMRLLGPKLSEFSESGQAVMKEKLTATDGFIPSGMNAFKFGDLPLLLKSEANFAKDAPSLQHLYLNLSIIQKIATLLVQQFPDERLKAPIVDKLVAFKSNCPTERELWEQTYQQIIYPERLRSRPLASVGTYFYARLEDDPAILKSGIIGKIDNVHDQYFCYFSHQERERNK